MYKKIQTLFLFSILFSGSHLAAQETVIVNPDVIRQYGDYNTVQPIFNGNVNGSDYGAANALVRELNLNGARAFLWPRLEKPYPKTPWAAAQFGGKPIRKEEVMEARKEWFRQDFPKTVPAGFLNKKGNWANAQFQQLQIFKDINLSENIVFHSQIDAGSRFYPERVNAYYSAYIKAIRKYAPWIKTFWIQNTNEPNYPWWSGEFDDPRESVKAWIQVYNSLDSFLRKNHPDVKVLGPVLAASSTFNWQDFNLWTKPVLAGAKNPLDIYNYHLYDIGAWSNLAWMSMFQAEAERIGRIRPRAYVSEIAYALGKKGNDGDLIHWTAQQLFTALENPDKIHALSWHLLVFDWFNNTNIIFKDRTRKTYAPGALFYLYRTLRYLRGTTVYVSPSANPALRGIAAMPDAKRLTLALFNDGREPLTVTPAPVFSAKPASLTVQSVIPSERSLYRYSTENLSPDTLRPISLAPGEVRSFEWTFSTPLKRPSKTLRQQEFYAPAAGDFFNEAISATIRLPKEPSANEHCFLRLGIYTDDKLYAEGGSIILNGKTFPVRWNQASQDVETVDNAWFFEIPVPAGLVKKENTFSIQVRDTDYKLMFASIICRAEPDAATAQKAAGNAIAWRNAEIFATSQPLGRLAHGEKKEYRIKLENNTMKSIEYQVEITVPNGVTPAGSSRERVTIPAGGKKLLKRKLEAVSDGMVNTREILARISAQGMRTKELKSALAIYPYREARYSSQTPTEKQWSTVPAVPFRKENIGSETKLLWNEKNLFFRIHVTGPFKPVSPQSMDGFFTKDVIEFFLDLSNTKPSQYDPSFSMQLFCCPGGVGNDPNPLCGSVIRARHGDYVDVTGRKREPEFKAEVKLIPDGGYIVTGALPWDTVQKKFSPRAGQKIGFDLALSHPGSKQTPRFSSSILGLKQKQHWSPKGWGILTLK